MTELPEIIYKKMSDKEKLDYLCAWSVGTPIYDRNGNITIYAGRWKFDQLHDFCTKMIEKYKDA